MDKYTKLFPKIIKLFGFSDGSEKGYRAVIYLLNPCSAELKKLIFLPSRTNCFIRLKNLSWLAEDPYSWKPYVANRTTKILKHIESCRWFYIESGMNRADYALKGLTPSEILDANLWWNGPNLNQLLPQVELVLDEEQTALIEKEMKKDTFVFFQSLSNPEIILTEVHLHLMTCHITNLLTEYYVRSKFYVPRLEDRVRTYIRYCITCYKYAKIKHQQLMGSSPFERVNSSIAFQHTGVDYAVPIIIKAYKSRCKIQLKAYIAVFVCLYSKCIHIEIVYDLSSDCFLAAFKRFTNRRGRCKRLYSDNGTNLKGAEYPIHQSDILKAELTWKLDLDATLKEYDTEWHFILISPHILVV